MQLFPAIDIRNKSVVRLTHGDYDKMKVYSDDPEKIAEGFAAAGAENMHVVDLDGAKDGSLANFDVIKRIVKGSKLSVQVGGGIRDEERIARYLECGVKRVIIGTAAVENFHFVRSAVKAFGDKIAVGVDAKDNRVAIHGWRTTTDIDSVGFCRKLRDAGVSTVVYTDISKDGALKGTNLEIYGELKKIEGLNVIASGGVTYYEELKALNKLGVYGAILGKALYEGLIDLSEALKINWGGDIC